MSNVNSTFLHSGKFREGVGKGPELITIRLAANEIGVETQVNWDALNAVCSSKQQSYLLMEDLRNMARAIGERSWDKFGRKWKRADEQFP